MTGAELKAFRREVLDLSQVQLVQRIGYRDPMSVSRWERDVEPIPQVVEMAIRHLACPPQRNR